MSSTIPQPVATSGQSTAASPTYTGQILHTVGNLLLLVGVYVLLYAGGLQVQIEYNRLAARGDNDLPAPLAVARPQSFDAGTVPAAFTAPVLEPPAWASNVWNGPEPPADAPFVSQVSRISIPAIGVDWKVVEVGWEIVTDPDGQQVAVWQVAEYAVGHHHGSANPGEGDNVVLAGHVGGYGMVFRDLYYVQPGDEITVYSGGEQYLYTVQERLVLDEENVPDEQRIANARYIQPTGTEMLTLVTCWPLDGPAQFSQRVIVRALPYAPAFAGDPADPTNPANPAGSADPAVLPSTWGLR